MRNYNLETFRQYYRRELILLKEILIFRFLIIIIHYLLRTSEESHCKNPTLFHSYRLIHEWFSPVWTDTSVPIIIVPARTLGDADGRTKGLGTVNDGLNRSVSASITWQCRCWIVASRLRFVSIRPVAGENLSLSTFSVSSISGVATVETAFGSIVSGSLNALAAAALFFSWSNLCWCFRYEVVIGKL